MASKNDITGDKIQTKGMLSKEGEANWDLIFGKKTKKVIVDDVHNLIISDDEDIDSKRLTDAFPGL